MGRRNRRNPDELTGLCDHLPDILDRPKLHRRLRRRFDDLSSLQAPRFRRIRFTTMNVPNPAERTSCPNYENAPQHARRLELHPLTARHHDRVARLPIAVPRFGMIHHPNEPNPMICSFSRSTTYSICASTTAITMP